MLNVRVVSTCALAILLVALSKEGRCISAAASERIDRKVNFGGVAFTYDASVLSEVKSDVVQASPLKDATEKPDNVAGRHVRFRFDGSYAARHESSFFAPEIRVFGVEDYRRAFSVSRDYLNGLNRRISRLKRLIALPSTRQREIPYAPFIDASQAFRAHIKRLRFRNGAGIAFLTQYNIEPSLINNAGLTYIFQGFTNDGRRYLLATFPVTTETLPGDYAARKHQGYTLPAGSQLTRREKYAYQSYLRTTERRLDRLREMRFEPSLRVFQRLIRSVRVD
jgi:hypothetical protein